MGGLFNPDNKLMMFLTTITDLIILNVIFVITCIPVFTIGAAVTSLYEITLKMAKGEESYMIKGYLKAFKSNFKKSTVMWVLVVIVFLILGMDIFIAWTREGTLWTALLATALGLFLGMIGIVSYIFPLQAKFENTMKNTLVNAWFMSIRHFPTTIMVVFMNCIVIFCAVFNTYTFYYGALAYMFLGFALVAYINSIYLVRVFEKYYEVQKIEE